MTDLTDSLQKIQNTTDQTTIGHFTFHNKKGDEYQINYKNHPLVREPINKKRLQQYEQVTQHYQTWEAEEDLPDIGNWKNLYGDPYWRHKKHSLQFRTAGVLNRRGYDKQIKSPDYFNPACLKKYHRSEGSAILTMLLTLVRHDPQEVAYKHHHQRKIIRQLQEIHGIGETTAEKLYDLGVRDYPDIKEHSGHIERVYRTDAMEEINEKIEQGIQLLEETGFLDDYSNQHIAKKI